MSDSRLNKSKMVNFHPTASDHVSGLNGSMFDGSTTKRPVFYFPLSGFFATSATAGSYKNLNDHSGYDNDGRFYNATGTNAANSSYKDTDVPWGNKLQNGLHKYSYHLGRIGKKGTTGWDEMWEFDLAGTTPFLRAPTSLNVTNSNGTVITDTAVNLFGKSYTTMAWFKPDKQVFENANGTNDIMALIDLRYQESLFYRWEDGKLGWEVNAPDGLGVTYDYQLRTIEEKLFKPDVWYHIAVSRDVENRKPPRIYVNGKRVKLHHAKAWIGSSQAPQQNIPEAQPLTSSIYLGRFRTQHVNADSPGDTPGNIGHGQYGAQKNFIGKVTQWIGWHQQLSDRDIYAIYGTCLTGFKRKSGFLDLIPVRERLFIKDNKTGSYPTILRSGDPSRMGNYRSFYDDRNTVVFKKHFDIFPGEIDKIKKGFDYDDIMGWWRMQELFSPCWGSGAVRENWLGKTTLHGNPYNDVVHRIRQSFSSDADAHGRFGHPGAGRQRLSDSGPNALTATLSGSATFTQAPALKIPSSSWGPFPMLKESDRELMSQDQLSRWGGRTAVFFPNTGSEGAKGRPSFVEITEHNKPRMRLTKELKNGKRQDKPWTLSMWVNLKDKLGTSADTGGLSDLSKESKHGLFRIENASGSLTRARIHRSSDMNGKWSIKWYVYGLNDDDTDAPLPQAEVTTDFLTQNGRRIGHIKLQRHVNDYTYGMPKGWHHLAFVYRGGAVKESEAHWKGRTKNFSAGIYNSLVDKRSSISGGRMQIWLDGRQLVTSATLENIDDFKRIREPHENIAYGKKVILGHWNGPSIRSTAESGMTGSMSGSMCEVSLIGKALKKAAINRIIANGFNPPSINVANYPLMLDKDNMHMDRVPATDITTFGSTVPGTSDNRIAFTKGDNLTPFSDNKTIIASGSALIGTPVHVAPDLEAPLGSKTSFTINITPKADLHLLKFCYSGRTLTGPVLNSPANSGVGRSFLRALARQQDITNHPGTFPTAGQAKEEALPGLVSSGGQIPIGDYTGFTYFNFNDGKWEQVGLYDPATGNRIYYDYAISKGDISVMSATFPQQFKPSARSRIGLNTTNPDDDGYESHSYGTAGRPSMHCLAPYATVYHATSSQVLKMSKFIRQPFLLERIRVSLPVEAFKAIRGDDDNHFTNARFPGDTDGGAHKAAGYFSSRQTAHEDNLVFFIYRQTRPKNPHLRPPKQFTHHNFTGSTVSQKIVDQYRHPSVVSGSNRFLICSGVACFYNDSRWAPNSVPNVSKTDPGAYKHTYEPLHTPAWKYNWNLPITGSRENYYQRIASGTANGVFTGSIIMDIKPAIQGPTSLGKFGIYKGQTSYTPGWSDAGGDDDGGINSKPDNSSDNTLSIGGSWLGGTSYKNLYPANNSGQNRGPYCGRTTELGVGGEGNFSNSSTAHAHVAALLGDITSQKGSFMSMTPNSYVNDPRTRSFIGTARNLNSSGTPQFLAEGEDDHSIVEHPYLLLPEDELIFGLDYLPTIVSYGVSANELTGSYIKLLSTGSATVTLYGSFFKEGKPTSEMLNQNLTSNAVHEVVGNDPIFDQYMINDRSEYSGSYIDNIMRGGPPGIGGMIDSYQGGRNKLVYSGNMNFGCRWRQSIVGQGPLKVISSWLPIVRTGSIYSVPPNGATMMYQMINTPFGGPVWGVKHPPGGTGPMTRLSYNTTEPPGQFRYEGGAANDATAHTFTMAGPTGTPALYYKGQALQRPLPISLLRGVRIPTNNERYYDSLIPHLGQYAKHHKAAIVMGPDHADTKGTRRPAISLPGQTSICSTGSFARTLGRSGGLTEGFVSHRFVGGIGHYNGTAANQFFRVHNDNPATMKGGKFEVEPKHRSVWNRSDSYAAGSDNIYTSNVATGQHVNVGDDRFNRYVEGPDQQEGGPVGSSARAAINAAVYSGSLAFPFEMNPRRMVKPQRYMLTMYTGTLNHSADAGSGQASPNLYMKSPKQVRNVLFRMGVNTYKSLFSILGAERDRLRIMVPNSSQTAHPTYGLVRGLRGMHYTIQSKIGGFGAIRGWIHCKSSGVSTGSFCMFNQSSHHGGGAEGFRYGLINTEPMNTSAVFRHDQYGQFRDMMEQRQYTRFYKNVQRPIFKVFGGFQSFRNRTNSTVTQGPVSIRFKSTTTGRAIKPVRTNSQNLSPVASSSLPYFDADRGGKFRNRPYPFDETAIDSHVMVDEDAE